MAPEEPGLVSGAALLQHMRDTSRLSDTVAGRLAQVEMLMRMPVVDEVGEVIGYEPVITPEQARELLDGDDEVAKRCFEELSRREAALEAKP